MTPRDEAARELWALSMIQCQFAKEPGAKVPPNAVEQLLAQLDARHGPGAVPFLQTFERSGIMDAQWLVKKGAP